MIDVEEMGRLVAREKCLYHLLWGATPDKVSSVLEHGLERVQSNYVGFWESRPDHVYLGSLEIVKRRFGGAPGKAWVNDRGEADWALFTVDLNALDHRRVDPDEDWFGLRQTDEGLEVSRRFHLPFSPSKWAWDWAEYLHIRTPASLGEWAEAVDLGSDPATTAYSASRGSISYRGVVPPSALSFVQASGPPHQVSYALYWSLGIILVPVGVVGLGLAFVVLGDFIKWVLGAEQKRTEQENRAARIDRLERELGIGPYRREPLP